MATQDAAQQKAQAELDVMKAELQQIKAQIERAKADQKLKSEMSLEELDRKLDDAWKRLEEGKQTTDAAWHEMKAGVGEAVDDIRRSWDRVREQLSR